MRGAMLVVFILLLIVCAPKGKGGGGFSRKLQKVVISVFDLEDSSRAYAEVLGKGTFGNLQGDF